MGHSSSPHPSTVICDALSPAGQTPNQPWKALWNCKLKWILPLFKLFCLLIWLQQWEINTGFEGEYTEIWKSKELSSGVQCVDPKPSLRSLNFQVRDDTARAHVVKVGRISYELCWIRMFLSGSKYLNAWPQLVALFELFRRWNLAWGSRSLGHNLRIHRLFHVCFACLLLLCALRCEHSVFCSRCLWPCLYTMKDSYLSGK